MNGAVRELELMLRGGEVVLREFWAARFEILELGAAAVLLALAWSLWRECRADAEHAPD